MKQENMFEVHMLTEGHDFDQIDCDRRKVVDECVLESPNK